MSRLARLLASTAPACLACAALAQTAAPAPTGATASAPDTGAAVVPPSQAAPPVAAPSRVGPYVVVALGRSEYESLCYFFVTCDNTRASGGKLGLGYRSGVFAVEGWWSDFGKGGPTKSSGSAQMRALGVSANWALRFADVFEGLLRAGLADVRYTVTGNGQSVSESHFQPTFGLGLAVAVTPAVAVELAWDVTRGDAANESTAFVNAVTLGLRFRF